MSEVAAAAARDLAIIYYVICYFCGESSYRANEDAVILLSCAVTFQHTSADALLYKHILQPASVTVAWPVGILAPS